MMDRREFLLSGAGAATALLLPISGASADLVNDRALAIHNLNTDESAMIAYVRRGRYIRDGLRRLSVIMRDWRTNEIIPVDLRLLDVLYVLQIMSGTREPIRLTSGYRSAASNRLLARTDPDVAQNSFHIKGQAADIRIPGVSLATLRDHAVSLRSGGVGYYPSSGFVHVDVGPSRVWTK